MSATSLPAGAYTDHSKTALAGTSEELFPARAWGTVLEREVHNCSATNFIAINCVDGPAALYTGGSITIPPGGDRSFACTNQVNVIGTAGDDVTAYERLG